MMGDIYILNKNLEIIGTVDTYKSCIWATRYKEKGDCELYIEASINKLNLLKKGNYLIRIKDDMICKINKIELDTDSESGNYLIVSGIDVKSFLYQRIIWETMICDGNVEEFIRNMIDINICNPINPDRKLTLPNNEQLLYLGEKSQFTDITTEQISYKNIGTKIEEFCNTYDWGFKIILDNFKFYFQLYKGVDRTDYVVFSDDYENLDTTKYVEDDTNLGNVALIGGEGEGVLRTKEISGNASSTDRYEIFVDAKDISRSINYSELTELYPDGTIVTENDKYGYKMDYINVQIVDENQLNKLKFDYPNGEEVIIDNYLYYKIENIIIADLEINEPSDSTDVVLRDVIYSIYLLNRGYEKLTEYGSTTSFEGTIEPNVTFEYKKDYFLGDLVTVENEYGISVSARIVEVIEIDDDTGYRIQPKFEYMN